MTLVGFRRMHIVSDVDGISNHYVVEGNKDLGATSTAEITGISKEPTKVPGSDGIYAVLQSGTGEISVNLGLLDLPYEVENEILGYQKSTEGFIKIGESTEPPVCSVVLESSDMRGVPIFYGFFNGKFSKETQNMATKTPESEEIEADSYIYSPFTSQEGDFKGEVALLHKGEEKKDEFLAAFGINAATQTRSFIVADADQPKKK